MVLSKLFKRVFICESKRQFPTTVALVGGSFKPPTAAHWSMVQQYADKADSVTVVISDSRSSKSMRKTTSGQMITAQMAKSIFDVYIDSYGLKGKVQAVVSLEPSPIVAIYKFISKNLKDVNVMLGVSTKGGDEAKFKTAQRYFEGNSHINLIDPASTAVEPFIGADGAPMSATDMCMHFDDPNAVKQFLPSKLSARDVQKVLGILGVQPDNELSFGSMQPEDETEDFHLSITDKLLSTARIAAYNIGMQAEDQRGKVVPVTPKKFPDKAVDIIFPVKQLLVEVFLDTQSKKWDSCVCAQGSSKMVAKLSPEQMGQFFATQFCKRLLAKLQSEWPLSDEMYGDLYAAAAGCEMLVGCPAPIVEGSDTEDKDVAPSGRKLINFGDLGVDTKSAKFMCWPAKGKEFNWSQWKDWKKIKPLCRMKFRYDNKHWYGLSLPVFDSDYNMRGFKSYDLTAQPILQWLTKDESVDLMNLSLVSKFIKFCSKRIQKYVNMDPEDVHSKINNPDMITVKQIANTQAKIRATLNNIIKKKQPDSFKFTED